MTSGSIENLSIARKMLQNQFPASAPLVKSKVNFEKSTELNMVLI
jgi:hypothetical protein